MAQLPSSLFRPDPENGTVEGMTYLQVRAQCTHGAEQSSINSQEDQSMTPSNAAVSENSGSRARNEAELAPSSVAFQTPNFSIADSAHPYDQRQQRRRRPDRQIYQPPSSPAQTVYYDSPTGDGALVAAMDTGPVPASQRSGQIVPLDLHQNLQHVQDTPEKASLKTEVHSLWHQLRQVLHSAIEEMSSYRNSFEAVVSQYEMKAREIARSESDEKEANIAEVLSKKFMSQLADMRNRDAMSAENLKMHLHKIECEANDALVNAQSEATALRLHAQQVEERAHAKNLRLRGEADEHIMKLSQELASYQQIADSSARKSAEQSELLKVEWEAHAESQRRQMQIEFEAMRQQEASTMQAFILESEVHRSNYSDNYENQRNVFLDELTEQRRVFQREHIAQHELVNMRTHELIEQRQLFVQEASQRRETIEALEERNSNQGRTIESIMNEMQDFRKTFLCELEEAKANKPEPPRVDQSDELSSVGPDILLIFFININYYKIS